MPKITRPYYPIIYVRGYAMTRSEIAATVATPYMGFNLGATKTRQDWRGKPVRHIFESPLVRLMKEYGYADVYADGREIEDRLPARSVVIYRYYEQADRDLGTGEVPSILEAARGLRELIHRVRRQVCGDDAAARRDFRVYLVAHSMGGLVCRCLLQNDAVSDAEDRALVDKVFTYATPHNGIEMAGLNVPAFLGLWDLNNFNREKMAEYLDLPEGAGRVDTLNGRFPPQRFFCLVGTNHRDYEAVGGLSSLLAKEMSDGLVRIDNAAVQGAPRAFVHRSHSGPYGIVNSEDGYQNLARFLFGDVKVRASLEPEVLPLPPAVRKAREAGREVRASYYFEATVAPRGALTYTLSQRSKPTHSAVLRRFDEMLKVGNTKLEQPRWPVLFSVFLDTRRTPRNKRSILFTAELAISTTGYTIDNTFRFDAHLPGEYLFRDTVSLRLTPGPDGWTLHYILADQEWAEGRGRKAQQDAEGHFVIPLASKKGFRGRLRLRVGRNEG